MIRTGLQGDITVTYTTTKAKVHESSGREEQMNFIIDHRPIVVYQFWIDITGGKEIHKMLYSKAIPAPDSYVPSDI